MAEDWTIGRLLTWTTDYLKQHGADSPRLDAEVLLAFARGCQRIQLYTAFDEPADEALRTRFRALVKQRADGAPVAYLVGHREFYSMQFVVSTDVLIPRPETEHLVVRLLDLARKLSAERNGAALDICDIGTGSGVIAVVAAKLLPTANIVAIDQSEAALAVAQANATKHKVAERITWIQGDLLSELPVDAQFDLIASNPPYISQPEYDQLSRTVREYEPREALLGGPTGTEVIARLIPQAASRLRSGGHLLIEVSPMIEPAVCALIEKEASLVLEPTIKDLAQLPRTVHARRK
ncbi:MAG: peptide chain release factor N(5)-glutamine methyltransferase [Planctomycetota bacterium]|nr:peptide chain release factor N(5)-glutamine methyltransferase [Planctomycetota bacterium]